MDADRLYRTILDALPSPVLVVVPDVRIVDYNAAAAPLMGEEPEMVLRQRAGEVLHCLNATKRPQGCGHAPECRNCVVRKSVARSFAGEKLVRQKVRMELLRPDKVVEVHFLLTTVPLDHRKEPLVLVILEDISELVQLKRLLPFCGRCKKVRDDQQYWHDVETFFGRELDIDFTHGICPDCARELYPEAYEDS